LATVALFGRETEADRVRADSWGRWARQQNVLAMVSVVLGVFSLIELNALIVSGVAGVATGVVALRQLAHPTGERISGRALAWAGIITSLLGFVGSIVLYSGHLR
jgi:hypothetical protein